MVIYVDSKEPHPKPIAKVCTIKRVDAKRVITLQSDVREGFLANERLARLQKKLKDADFALDIQVAVKGDSEEQQKTGLFLGQAQLYFLHRVC